MGSAINPAINSLWTFVVLAVFAVVGLNFDFSGIYGGSFETVGAIVGVIAFAALLGSMMYFCKGKKKQNA